jgi:hypothetical protein
MRNLFSIILLFIFFVGCKDHPVSPDTPQGVGTGIVHLFDGDGNAVSDSAVIVSATGTDITAVTDKSGTWHIIGLSKGKHTFTFTKQGFGTMKVFDMESTGSDTASAGTVYMTQTPGDRVNFQTFRIDIPAGDSIPQFTVQGAVPVPHGIRRSLVLCIDSDSSIAAHDPASSQILLQFITDSTISPPIVYDGGFLWSSNSEPILHKVKIAHGMKLFAAICVSGVGPNCEYFSNYFDALLDRQMFTSLGLHAQILTARMP